MKHGIWLFPVVVSLLTGCGTLSETESSPPEPKEVTWPDEVSQTATLIHHLPDDTLAYARLPNVAGLVMAPKSNGMGQLLQSDANEVAVRQLLASARRELAMFGAEGALADLLLERLRSPLEIAIRLPDGAALTAAQIQLSARLDFADRAAFTRALERVAQTSPAVRLFEPDTEQSAGFLDLGMLPAYYRFDEAQRRLTLVAGFSAGRDGPASVGARRNPAHPALQRQADMDDSGRGLYLWANVDAFAHQVQAFVPPAQQRELTEMGLFDVEEFSLGLGTVQGRGQSSLLVTGQPGRLWDLALPASPATRLTTQGKPDLYAAMTLPGDEWIGAVDAVVEDDFSKLDQALRSQGLSRARLFNGLAGRLSFIRDDAGTYVALEPRDPAAFESLVTGLTETGTLRITDREYAGQSLQHWFVPLSDLFDGDVPGERLFMRTQNTHLWVQRVGDAWLLASLPQMLMARIDDGASFELESWLATAGQSSTTQNALMIGSIDQLVRTNYHYYLEMVQTLADMLEAPVDLLTFPTARSAAIPEQTDVSFSATYQEQTLKMVYAYENHPLDPLQHSMTNVAYLGILAAVAIPAYQDYVERAEAAALMSN